MIREVSKRDPTLASEALTGLRDYQSAPRRKQRAPDPELARIGPATLRDHGGTGPPVLLVPSLINPPRILDLDDDVSLTRAIAQMGRRTMLLDWGDARQRSQLSVAEHIEKLLCPLLRDIGEPVALLGYCLGGTMAIAAANLIEVQRVITLAAPWRFGRYPERSSRALLDMWSHSRVAAKSLGALPMEVLQAAFWSLDPQRTVRKFAEFGKLGPGSPEARRFIELEEWANEGEPLPYPAAKELVEELFGSDRPGTGQWRVGGRTVSDRLSVPSLHLTAQRDLIAPPQTAASGEIVAIDSGHVGMIVGSQRQTLHRELRSVLHADCR